MKRFLILFPLYAFLCPLIAYAQTSGPETGLSTATPTPSDFGGQVTPTIISTTAVATPAKPKEFKSRVPLSGIVLAPTAYRGKGENSIGLGLDINAAYYIGRLYGKNTFDWTLYQKNYLDRVGVWLLMADAKMLIQTEGKLRPAMSAGVQEIFQLRDAPQSARSFSFKLDTKNNDTYTNVYIVFSKRLHPRFILNAGYSDGDSTKMIYQFSEFLSKEAINRANNKNINTQITFPDNIVFGGIIWMLNPNYPIGIEFLIPQGAPRKPRLINLHLGSLLKLNFELSYLKFDGGWDLLGMFQFRYSYFPK